MSLFSKVLTSLVLISIISTSHATRRYIDPGGIDIVRYPSNIYSAKDIDDLMRLSPKLHMATSYPIVNDIAMCIKGRERYSGCGTEGANGEYFIANTRVNIREMSEALDELKNIPVRKNLIHVIEYEKKLQEFYLHINQVRLDFFISRDLSLLERPIGGVDPLSKCSESIHQVRNTSTMQTANIALTMSWYNCMNKNFRSDVGQYPIKEWELFLTNSRINETYVATDDE